jgi:hypothetical protein
MHRTPARFLLALAAAAAWAGAIAAPASATTENFAYTGASQTWVVPQGVTEATFDLLGAQGGADGGRGGRATATIAVTPGQSVQVNVGGRGVADLSNPSGSAGGFNGGGYAWSGPSGGGATDIRFGGTDLADRMLIAGGGGGGGGGMTAGAGGGLNGRPAVSSLPGSSPGAGGTQTEGGPGFGFVGGGGSGSLGQGGSAIPATPGGAGGGGLYGGAAGAYAGGGGGSGFGPAGTTFETGVREGDGAASVEYAVVPPDQPPAITDLAVTPRKFVQSGKRAAALRAKAPKVGLTLSEDAAVTFRVRRDPPRRSGGRPPKNPRRVTLSLEGGANKVPLSSALPKGTTLKPRRYTLRAVATDPAGQRSDPAVTGFRVLRP